MSEFGKISVVIHTLNSGKYLRQCLESVCVFDEIIVCDMYSADNTLNIAKEFGAKIVMHEPTGGIPEPARTFAVSQATQTWVLVVDSDEVIPETLKDYLYRTIASKNCPDALFLPRKNYFMNRFMRATFPDYQLRFFKKNAFKGWPVVIHSRPQIEGVISKIPAKKSLAIIHLEENRISDWILKTNRYSERELERSKHKRKNVAELLFKPLYHFFLLYFIKRGFLDGKAGLIYAIIRAYYKFFIDAKVIERQEQQSNQQSIRFR